jgi:hypothetical protein
MSPGARAPELLPNHVIHAFVDNVSIRAYTELVGSFKGLDVRNADRGCSAWANVQCHGRAGSECAVYDCVECRAILIGVQSNVLDVKIVDREGLEVRINAWKNGYI